MPEMCRKTIVMPEAIHSTYQGYLDLLETFHCYVDERNAYSEITMNFRENAWFDANLLPIIYAYVEYGQTKYSIVSRYDNQLDCNLHRLLIRNNFAKLFQRALKYLLRMFCFQSLSIHIFKQTVQLLQKNAALLSIAS